MERQIQNVPAGPEQIEQLQRGKPQQATDAFGPVRWLMALLLAAGSYYETKSICVPVFLMCLFVMFEVQSHLIRSAGN